MSDGKLRVESRAEAARRTAEEADQSYANTLEEIKEHFSLLLRLRDRKIEELEEKLTVAPARSHIDFDVKDRLDFKLLVVENSAVLRAALGAALRRKFHVLSVADGYAALEFMVERPDLILTDLDLPYVDGADMIRHVRRLTEELPIMVMYDRKDKDMLARVRPLGVRAFIRKPFRLDSVVDKAEAIAKTCKTHVKARVLAVCPNAQERHALYRLLDDRYHTLVAASGETALEMAEERPDVLILDVGLKDYPWKKVATAFLIKRRDTKVLALCDHDGAESVRTNGDVRGEELILRPYSFDELLLRIRKLLGIEEVDGFLRTVFRRVT